MKINVVTIFANVLFTFDSSLSAGGSLVGPLRMAFTFHYQLGTIYGREREEENQVDVSRSWMGVNGLNEDGSNNKSETNRVVC